MSVDANYTTSYIYSQDGERTNKYTSSSETLYFNKMWSLHTDAGNSIHGGQYAKNVYLGETRIVTKLCLRNDPRADAEKLQQYFYHSDHLGSASLISDYKGDEYQRIEYTPYGETWIERTDNTGLEYLPYKFTAKELDEETGLYYYGARYLNPKYSMWISCDPAMNTGEYFPQAPVNDEIRRNNQNLPGMGGIFNHINFHLYHYAGNNPVRYIDPDGREVKSTLVKYYMNDDTNEGIMLGSQQPNRGGKNQPPILKVSGYGCVLTDASRIANSIIGRSEFTPAEANKVGKDNKVFLLDKSDNMKDVTVLDGFAFARLINVLIRKNGINTKFVSFEEQFKGSLADCFDKYENMEGEYYFSIRYKGGHTVSFEILMNAGKKCYIIKDTSTDTYSTVDYDTIEYINVYKVNRKSSGDYYYE